MFNQTLGTLVAAFVVAVFVGSAQAAEILFVDSDAGLDSSWQTLIESGGHNFTLYTGDFNPNTQAEKDAIQDNFDVVVMSGSNANFNSVRANGANWESLTTPMLQLSNFLLTGQFSSASWRWTTPTNGGTGGVTGALNVLDPANPIFAGVTLNPGAPQTTNDLFDGTAGTLTLGTDSLLPGITLIAYDAVGEVAIAHASGIFAADHIFLAGGTGSNGADEPYNAEGEKVFLNALGVLSGELVVPEPASIALLGLGGLMMFRRRRA